MTVFVTCSVYALGCIAGPKRAIELVTNAVLNPDADPPVLAVGTLRGLRLLAPIALRIDGGATHLSKSRSRHFAAAFESAMDVWFSVDDDVNLDDLALATMLAAVESTEPRICLAPCPLRSDASIVNVEWSPLVVKRVIALPCSKARDVLPRLAVEGPGMVRRAVRGGFGAVAVNRAAMIAIATSSPQWYDDADGKQKAAPFLEWLDGMRWVGEDLAFFERLPKSVQVEACITGRVQHGDGQLDLSVFD